jgi:peroxiredoxin
MKFLTLTLLVLFSYFSLFAQTNGEHEHPTGFDTDTVAPYLKSPHLPTFSIQQPDGSWFSRSELNDKKAVLLIYFSPDCGHCMEETEDLISKMNQLKNVQVVMVTSKPLDEMKTFSDHYQLHKFSNIRIGTDPQRRITRFYNVKFTPFSAVYNKKGNLLKAYESGIDWNELAKLID